MAGVRQIGEEQLREPHGYRTIAVLRITREELWQRGIALFEPVDDGTWDEAGPIEAAFIEVDSGEQALLVWHLAFEGTDYPPLELRTPVSLSDPGRYVENMLRAFGIGNERVEWIIAPSDWP